VPKVDQQQNPLLLREVPNFVLISVIEHQTLSFHPFPDLVSDADAAGKAGLQGGEGVELGERRSAPWGDRVWAGS
jgi:hypothetical protein